MRRIPATLVALGILLFPGPLVVRAGGFGGLEGGAETTDNVTKAVFDEDKENETFFFLDGSGGWRLQPGKNHSVFVGGRLRAAAAVHADKLSHVAPGVSVRWRGKTRIGRNAPRWLGAVKVDYLGFESEVRRGWLYEARFGYATPVGQRWTVRAEGLASSRDADSEAFSQDAWAIELHADLQVSAAWSLYGDYRYRDGDVTSTATPGFVDPRVRPIFEQSTARVADDAFPGKIAYRLDGQSHLVGVGANAALATSGSFDFRYAYEYTDAGDGIDYRTHTLRATWLQRF